MCAGPIVHMLTQSNNWATVNTVTISHLIFMAKGTLVIMRTS